MDVGINYEIWTLPSIGPTARIADVSRWVVDSNIDDRLSDLTSARIDVHVTCPYLDQILDVDPDDHNNDVGAMWMLFRDGTWLASAIAVERDDPTSDTDNVVTFTLEGPEWFLDRARIRAFDHPADPIREGDWLYGTPSILPEAGDSISNERTEIFRSDGTSTGTFTLTDGTDTTLAINWDATAADLKTRLETDISAILEVSVSGNGSTAFPWAIEVTDPAATNLTDLTVGTNSTDGVISVNIIRDGGTLSPLPWHGSVDATTGLRVGTYQAFEMVEAGIGGVPPAPVGSTSTHLLKLDPDTLRGPGDYAGAQVEPRIVPNHRYRANIKVRSPISSQRVRLSIRDLDENMVAWIETSVADAWVTLTAVDVDATPFIEFPEGINPIVYRVGVVEEDQADPIYIDINDALLAPGEDEAPLGQILGDLLAPITTRNVLDWLVPTYSDTLDSNGAAWDQNLAWGVRRGQSILQILEYARRWGYEWTITYNPTNPAATPFDLNVYNPGGAGTDYTGQGGPSINPFDGTLDGGADVKRAPDASYVVAEGADGRWGDATDLNLESGFGRLESYFVNRQGRDSTKLATLASQVVSDSAVESTGRRIRVQNPVNTPGDVIRNGDIVPVITNTHDGSTTTRPMRVVGITISHRAQAAPIYDYHLDSIVLEPEAAQADAVRALVRAFRAIEDGTNLATSSALNEGATAIESGGGDLLIFTWPGPAYVGAGGIQIPLKAGTLGTVEVRSVNAPTGADLIADVLLNGATILPAGKATITAGTNESGDITPDTTATADGDYLTVAIDQVGSTITGGPLVWTVEWSPS